MAKNYETQQKYIASLLRDLICGSGIQFGLQCIFLYLKVNGVIIYVPVLMY